MRKQSVVLTALLLLVLACPVIYAEEPPPEEPPISLRDITDSVRTEESGLKPVLKDIQTAGQDGLRYIIKLYETAPNTDPTSLVEEDFDKNGFHFEYCAVLEASKNFVTQKKLASQIMTVNSETRDGAAAKFTPFIDYSMDGFQGQLKLERDSICTEAAGTRRYSYGISDIRSFQGLERNDTYYIPKTVSKNGNTLHLADVQWQPMGDGLYNATATYSGSANGTKITGYLSTGTYLGEIEKKELDSVTYKVIYEGTPIPAPPADYTPWLLGGGILLAVALASALLLVFRRNARLYAMMPDGRYKLIHRYRLSHIDPVVDMTNPLMEQYSDYILATDRMTGRRLGGQPIRILTRDENATLQPLVRHGWDYSMQFHTGWPSATMPFHLEEDET